MGSSSQNVVRVFDLQLPSTVVDKLTLDDLKSVGYPVTQDTAPVGRVSDADGIEVAKGRDPNDVKQAALALTASFTGGRPAFRPGPNATPAIVAGYLEEQYPEVIRHLDRSVLSSLDPDGIARDFQDEHWPKSGRTPPCQSYRPESAIALARAIASRVTNPADLSMFATAADKLITDLPGNCYPNERAAYVSVFRSEVNNILSADVR